MSDKKELLKKDFRENDYTEEELLARFTISKDMNDLYKSGVIVETTWEEVEKLGLQECKAVDLKTALKSNLMMSNENDRKNYQTYIDVIK